MTVLTLDPSTWPQDEVEEYLRRTACFKDLATPSATGGRGLVLGSTGTFAQLAGRRALELGGSAVDAALVTSLAQIALAAGAWVSYAGMTTILHWDKARGRVESLNAGFRTPAAELDPLSIPKKPVPSGRTALVPGYFKGLEVAHARFGRLPWEELFRPAIFIAEHGFPVGDTMAGFFALRRDVFRLTPEGRGVFLGASGEVPREGAVFRQPELAATLQAIATQGSDYVYIGDWGRRFVEVVGREGGTVSLADLAAYDVGWHEPLRGRYGDFEVAAAGLPDFGGATLIEGLHLAQLAGITDAKDSPEDLYWLVQIARLAWLNIRTPPERRVTTEHAEQTWSQMQAAGFAVGTDLIPAGTHSDYVVTADADGNVVAMCHTSNCSLWGTTGIVVDGICIPDAANYQQELMLSAGPAARLPNPMNPSIVLRDGQAVLASSSIGSGLMEATLQRVLSVLARDLDVVDAVREPIFHGPAMLAGDTINSATEARTGAPAEVASTASAPEQQSGGLGAPDPHHELARAFAQSPQVILDSFPAEVIAGAEALGLRLTVLPEGDATIPRGYWGAIQIDPETGWFTGARTSFCNGAVEAL